MATVHRSVVGESDMAELLHSTPFSFLISPLFLSIPFPLNLIFPLPPIPCPLRLQTQNICMKRWKKKEFREWDREKRYGWVRRSGGDRRGGARAGELLLLLRTPGFLPCQCP